MDEQRIREIIREELAAHEERLNSSSAINLECSNDDRQVVAKALENLKK